ncbi:PREDICTED: uncharacterized protein LOC104803349 [Tarenaya hassleriana]|uniref:uncharacterized protein LOC104803349 n=1 Tax=Tarenaya hassleriana TaxID=28532 RepID=UPI00053C1FC0|nr:PREDICTED: uncharacterized protein LOC104803349 [Tarenaya hassleriana]
MGNLAWFEKYAKIYAEFGNLGPSDHCPCILRWPTTQRKLKKPFKFFHHLIDHPDFQETVRESWMSQVEPGTQQFRLCQKLKKLKKPLQKLNRKDFSNISIRVKQLERQLENLQMDILTCPNRALLIVEHDTRQEWLRMVAAEETGYNREKDTKGAAIKVDIRKAFDTLEWSFILRVLEAIKLPRVYIGWIRACITTPKFSISVNGELAGYFHGGQGSIIPLPFHPLNGEIDSFATIKGILQHFGNMSGLIINPEKLEVFIAGRQDKCHEELADVVGCKIGKLPIRYLGVPLSPWKPSKRDFQPLIERMKSKLVAWTTKHLSFAGKLQLINSLSTAYAQNSSSSGTGRSRARVSWDCICIPKAEGGLGLRNLIEVNLVQRLKLVWILFTKQKCLWVRWIRKNVLKKKVRDGRIARF